MGRTSHSTDNDPAPGSRALVFGGNRGIGRAVVDRFVARGCVVAYASRTAGRDDGPSAFIEADLSDPRSGATVVRAAAERLGGLDVVVFGSASFAPRGPLESSSLEEVRRSLDVNLVAMYSALTASVGHLRVAPAGGRFVAISSITGPRTGLHGMAHYGMAKAGMEGLVRSAALELAADSITVNAVAPGLVRTESLVENYGPERLARMDSLVPGGHLGRPEDIASAVSWLASPGARHVNGATLVVDAGLTLVENPYAPGT